MNKEMRARLAQRFPQSRIKQRRGSFGKTLNYLKADDVVARLNECFENEWTFIIVNHQTFSSGEVMVHGRLEALGIVKEAFGRGSPAVSKETGEVLSMVDAYKAAVSDCIKRCSRLLGVGAYLYSDEVFEQDIETDNRSGEGVACLSDSKAANVAGTAGTVGVAQRSLADRLTQRQLAAIWNLGRKAGLDSEKVRQMSCERFNGSPEFLCKADASALIGVLTEIVDRRLCIAG